MYVERLINIQEGDAHTVAGWNINAFLFGNLEIINAALDDEIEGLDDVPLCISRTALRVFNDI
jgi:hypothetical protein